jgi:nucleotide-binding universal stress UspA family protein
MKKILIALDYSATAQYVLEMGNELAMAMNAQVALLHVVSDVTYYSSLKYSPIFGFDCYSSTDIVQTDTAEQLRTASLKYLEKSKKHLNNPTISTIVKSGDCSEMILGTANEFKADIIVMGTHSRGEFERIVLGSTSERVLRKSMIPLFIVPIKAAQARAPTTFQKDKIKLKKHTAS